MHTVTLSDLMDAREPKLGCLIIWKASKIEVFIYKTVKNKKNSTKLIRFRLIYHHCLLKANYPVHPLKPIGRLEIHIGFLKLKYDLWESLLRVTRHGARCNAQTLINQSSKTLNKLNEPALFSYFPVFWSNFHLPIFYLHVWYKML